MSPYSQLHAYQDEHDIPKELRLKRFDEPRYRVVQCYKRVSRFNRTSGQRWTENVQLSSYRVIGPTGRHSFRRTEAKAYMDAFLAHKHWRNTAAEQFTDPDNHWIKASIQACAIETAATGQSIYDWYEQNTPQKYPFEDFFARVKLLR